MQRLIATMLAAASILAAAQADAEKKGKAAQAKQESVTGCVDQRGEAYVLAGAGMKQEAKLAGKAFSDDNFARYIGHKVTVHGTVDRSASPVVVHVVRIEDVSNTCR